MVVELILIRQIEVVIVIDSCGLIDFLQPARAFIFVVLVIGSRE